MDVLVRIKRLVLKGQVRFTRKAKEETKADDLDAIEVFESIVGAQKISKTLRSQSPERGHPSEKLYVIKGYSYNGTPIYTKGKISREGDVDYF